MNRSSIDAAAEGTAVHRPLAPRGRLTQLGGMKHRHTTRAAILLAAALLTTDVRPLRAQDNYEIQVYGSETVAPGRTMVELHSNFTTQGRRTVEDSLSPTWHAEHETVEITHGVTPWAEVGFYFFTSERSGQGVQWVGDHIRPRVRVPEAWHWPVGLSMSVEFGYQRRPFSTDTWTLELRPIIDKQMGSWYVSLNPTFDRSFYGEGVHDGLVFSPNVAVGKDVSKVVNLGLEYYGSTGPLGRPFARDGQQHQLFAATNLNVSPDWELNAGVGQGFTPATDHRIVKLILGRRFGRQAAAGGRGEAPGPGTATPAGNKPAPEKPAP